MYNRILYCLNGKPFKGVPVWFMRQAGRYLPVFRKTRYQIEYKGYTWEVDEFHDENIGLIVAEIELDDENEIFERPIWLGEEVTADIRYLNSNLATNPYSKW